MNRRSITVGITGGSGAVYAVRLIDVLRTQYERVDVVISRSGRKVLAAELDISAPESGPWSPTTDDIDTSSNVHVWEDQNYQAPFASGSNCADQMVIVPCSMSTVGSLAHGIDSNLLHHAAAVSIKERKDLIVVPRETPLSAIHLRNLTALSELGVSVIPAMPGFYGGQKTFDDLVNFVLQKVCNQLRLDVNLSRKWGNDDEA